MQLSEGLIQPNATLFGILGQLSAVSKAVSIFRYCYFLILFYMKLIPFDISLAFFIQFYFLLVSTPGKKKKKKLCSVSLFPATVLLQALANLFYFLMHILKLISNFIPAHSLFFHHCYSLLTSFTLVYPCVCECFSSSSFDCFLHLEILLQCLLLDVLLCTTL